MTFNAERYQCERAFFDRVAAESTAEAMDPAILERYAHPQNPDLYPKERLFDWLGDLRHKKVLEVGCGDGTVSVQLAYCGADLVALDISPKSIEMARERANANNLEISFLEANLETDDLGAEEYDVVVCNCILHHVVPSLEVVVEKLHRCLKPGGMFISREPVAYARWLKTIRNVIPVKKFNTPDEQPLDDAEFQILEKHFPDLERQYQRILSRVDRVTTNLSLIAMLARIDNWIFKLPGSERLAGDVVMRAFKAPR